MPCEVGASALYYCLNDDTEEVIMKINEAKNVDLTLKAIRDKMIILPE